MTSKTVKAMTATVVYATCLTVSAADVTLEKSNDYNVGFNDTTCWSTGGTPVSGNDYWLLDTSKYLYSKAGNKGNESFAGDTLNIGSSSSSSFGFTSGRLSLATIARSTVTIPNLIWWSGMVNTGYNGTHLWYGTWTVRQADAAAYHRTGLNAAGHYYTNFVTLASSADDANAADAVIELGVGNSGSYPGSITATTMAGGTQGIHHWHGDCSGYKGSYNVAAPYQPFVLWNATIIGDPATPNASAIRLNTNAAIAFGTDFTQNTARGIEIYGTQAYFMTYSVFANAYTVKYPISGTGKFIKHGPGTVTLDCAYTACNITVQQGTLVIASGATFPSGRTITVNSGAKLVLNRADCWGEFTLDVKSGGTVDRHVVVGYDAATGDVTVPASIAAGATPDADGKIPLAFTEAISIPFHSTKRLAVATLGAGATFTAADFKDESAKTYGLPKTSFEIDGSTLYLVARPVAVSVENFGNSVCTINGANTGNNTNYWSNGRVAQPGFDYLLTNTVGRIGTADFVGESLTIAGSVNIDSQDATSRISKAIAYPPAVIRANSASYPNHTIVGDIAIASSYGASGCVGFRAVVGGSGRVSENLDVAANLSGDGEVRFRGTNVTPGMHKMGAHGDNSGFVGRIVVATDNGGNTDNRRLTTRLQFSAPENLGGEPSVFRYDAIKTQNYSFLNPDTTMTLATTNRGIDISSGGFDVPDGVTFTVKAPIRQELIGYKLGGGVLALGGTICWGSKGTTTKASESQRTVVEEGGISAVVDSGVKDMYLVMSNGTAIVVRPSDAVTNGITGTLSIPEGKVRVILDADSPLPESGNITVPICTLATSLGDPSPLFDMVKPRGCSVEIVKTPVVVDGVECTRYSARYHYVGFTVILR